MNNFTPPRAYPIHAMYKAIRDAILEVRRNLQAPDALIASSFLTAMSIACQGDADVELPTGQVRPLSLDVLVIADSGERKTATDSIVCAPIYSHDEKMAQRHNSISCLSQFVASRQPLLKRPKLTSLAK